MDGDILTRKDIQDRLERLESFVWKRTIAKECNYNTDGICCMTGSLKDRLCTIDICINVDWTGR